MNKGLFVEALIKNAQQQHPAGTVGSSGGIQQCDFILCCGDDGADEDMFTGRTGQDVIIIILYNCYNSSFSYTTTPTTTTIYYYYYYYHCSTSTTTALPLCLLSF
jgi:trehalose-6-phosphatase